MQKIKNIFSAFLLLVFVLVNFSFSNLKCEDEMVDVNLNEQLGIEMLKATEEGDLGRVEELLNARVPVDFKNENDETALHFAAQKNFLDIAALLVERGANVNALDYGKETPLFRSVCWNLGKMTWFLLRNGADVSLKNNYEENVLECVTKNNAFDIDLKILALLRFYLLKHYTGVPFKFCGRMLGFSN